VRGLGPDRSGNRLVGENFSHGTMETRTHGGIYFSAQIEEISALGLEDPFRTSLEEGWTRLGVRFSGCFIGTWVGREPLLQFESFDVQYIYIYIFSGKVLLMCDDPAHASITS
jgi:hypothetical protein